MSDTEKVLKKYGIYAVKDELTKSFLQPLFIETDPEAIRWFSFVLNDNRIWASNPGMYNLYKLGYFSEETGIMDIDNELVIGGPAVLKGD